MEATGLLATLLILSTVSERASEKLVGGLLSGKLMVLAAWGVGVVVTLAAWATAAYLPGFGDLAAVSLPGAIGLGVLVGLGADVVHGVFNRVLPTAKSTPLLGAGPAVDILASAKAKLTAAGIVLAAPAFYRHADVNKWIASLQASGVLSAKEAAAVLAEVFFLANAANAGFPKPPAG